MRAKQTGPGRSAKAPDAGVMALARIDPHVRLDDPPKRVNTQQGQRSQGRQGQTDQNRPGIFRPKPCPHDASK